MTIRIFLILIFTAPLLKVAGDIAPNPVKAKGIVPSGGLEIALKWERVFVDLYKDSSVVECQFLLKNYGKSQKVNIGFPEMNFYHFNFGYDKDKLPGNFIVHENGKKINRIEMYSADNQIHLLEGNVQPNLKLTGQDSYSERPWLLWDSQFEEFTTKLITVKYSLPHGQIKNRCRYFTYLLSTGSGWTGNIDSAEIIVNLKDLDPDLILQTTPTKYSQNKNQLKWVFTDFEPTTDHDIRIMYERFDGENERLVAKNPAPICIIDENKVVGMLGLLEPSDILTMHSINNPTEKAKYTTGNEGVMVIMTKNYAIRKFIDEIISKHLKSHKVKYLPHNEFITKYDLKIDKEYFEGMKMLQQLPEVSAKDISRIRLINKDSHKTTVYLKTRKTGKSSGSSST